MSTFVIRTNSFTCPITAFTCTHTSPCYPCPFSQKYSSPPFPYNPALKPFPDRTRFFSRPCISLTSPVYPHSYHMLCDLSASKFRSITPDSKATNIGIQVKPPRAILPPHPHLLASSGTRAHTPTHVPLQPRQVYMQSSKELRT